MAVVAVHKEEYQFVSFDEVTGFFDDEQLADVPSEILLAHKLAKDAFAKAARDLAQAARIANPKISITW